MKFHLIALLTTDQVLTFTRLSGIVSISGLLEDLAPKFKNCSKISVKPLESEVTRLLEAAKRMKDSKKIEKADKLFSQAMQFAPDHPELLSE